ncbi:IPT/TIG domain-containing protein [Mucilaginibacter gossypiicola]|uniref:IPT/TIG domain-containing protein n=1 Tax=Mucilaginibacter gossypiicola TaxID=551995 RepID=A0A1H8RF48_9SPHI|nr:IPT/TIG domain-containing protein [Mucilaginibacter gossypiicola]SEO64952.1 IPT/TIG domain-containing protein [Mucilaginibacter gossypiicola]
MYKLFLPAFLLCLFFSAKLSAQKPNINYPSPQTAYLGKSITPVKVNNIGGAVPNSIYPQVNRILSSTAIVTNFVRLPSGDIYGEQYRSILHIKPDGTYSTLAGSNEYGYADGVGANALFGDINNITNDAEGNLYVTEDNYRDALNSRVRKITTAGVVTTYAQGFRAPRGIVADANGIIYVAESAGRIMKIAKDGTTSVFAGKVGNGASDGLGTNASFNNPNGLAIDKAGNLYVADYTNNMIRKITPAGLVTTIAGSTKNGDDDGVGTAATFNYPENIKVDSKGYLIIGEHNDLLRKVSPTGEVYTIPGPYYDNNGQIVYQPFSTKIALDENDNIIACGGGFFSDGFYKINTTGYNVSPVLPAGLVLGTDGTISGTPSTLSDAANYKITASNASGMASTTINLQVVLSADPPVINSFSPKEGYPGTPIVITGNFFTGATGITFGGKDADYYQVSPTSISVYVPVGAASGEVTVTTPRGTARLSGFSFIPPPSISSVSPLTGWKGNKITITGTGFSNVNGVYFGGSYATYNINSPTQIEATLVDGASGDVYISAPSGNGRFPGFTYIGAPSVSSISPASGGAGATITINGSNFNNATTVKFGNTNATSFKVVSSTQITAVVAAGSSNGITVTTPAGTSGSYYNFSFIPPPVITQVYPTKAGYNSTIIIYGSGLSGALVTIGGVPANISYNYDSQLYANVGYGAASGDITITTAGGTVTHPGFVLVQAPTITSFTPQTAAIGDKVTITGTNLDEVDNVSFGGIGAAFKVLSSTQIEATVGYGTTGAVTVSSEGGYASLAGFTHTGPVITSFSPARAGIGETVIIKGSNFTNTSAVEFGGVPATSFTINSPSEITAIVGTGKAGNIAVTTPLGKATIAGFDHPGPVISYLNPAYAGALSATPVTITGNNFTGATSVSFGGVPAASFIVTSATSITATPAATSVSGNVVVTTPQGTDQISGFTWVQAPVITSFTPSSQKNGGTVTITGTDFYGNITVKFGGIPALYAYVSSPTTIAATVGNGASGNITVATAGGTATISGFKYSSPIIAAISPSFATAGQTIVITGENLDAIQSVKFGGTDAASFKIVSSKEIDAVIATGTSGTVSVTGPDGTAYKDGFTYVYPPVIYSFTPTSGGSGTIMNISGYYLASTSEVKVGGVPATITSVTDYLVTAKVGTGATGKVSLKTVAGLAESDGFTWYPAPTITSVSPLKANAQTTVTINGTNFTGITQLQFGANYANFKIVSPTQITAEPAYGESGDITITGPGGSAVFSGFTFIPAPVVSSYTKSGDASNAVVTITGNNFQDVTEVKFGGVTATSFTVLSPTSISAKPGAGATGAISVKAAGGTGTLLGYLYDTPPSIASFSPASGPIGTTVAIEGGNFSTSPQKNVVFFGPVKGRVKSATKTHLEVIVPAGANNLITVVNTDKKLSGSSNLPFIVTNTAGATSFSNRLDIKLKSAVGVMAIHDFDGDGNPDILISREDSIYILRHGADPLLSKSSFLQKIVLESEREAMAVTVGDVDGDGKMDIMYSNTPSINVLHNTSTNGNISFEHITLENLNGTTGSIMLRDMNLDGRPDLVIYESFVGYCYPNTSTGSNISFGPIMVLRNTSSSGTNCIAITDIDGDNKPDPIAASSYTGISIFKNNSVPGDLSESDFPLTYFTHRGYYYETQEMVTADFDGDNKADIVEDDFAANQLLISRNIATKGTIDASSLDEARAFSNSSMTSNLSVADMNGDGKIDLVGASYNGVYYARNQSSVGNISIAGAAPLITGSQNTLAAIRLNDMDSDGRMDIMAMNINNSTFTIYHNGPVVTPKITAVSPLTAKAGTKITITGEHFDETTVVKFGSKIAQSFKVDSTQTITAIVGEGETGAISIQTPNGPASFPGFVFIPAPVITSANALTDGSGTLIINGSNLTKATGVTIGGIPASAFIVNSDTKITATFPGVSGDLAVTTAGGTATLPGITVKYNLVINFPALTNLTYGDNDFLLPAVSNNVTIPITYNVDKPDVAIITNGKLHIIKAGTITITASQIGDALNNSASEAKQILVISKKALQIKAADQTRVFGMANPVLTFDYSGFISGEDKTKLSVLPIISTVANKQSPAGIYDIVVSGAVSDNYDFNYVNGKLTVTASVTNLKIATNSVTCKGQNNGSINITAAQSANYSAVITGNGLNKTYTFSTEKNIGDLSPGTYNVCITDAALANIKQCFDLVITEPKDLSVYTSVNEATEMVNITMDGGASYDIKLNGVSYKTTNNTISLPLNKGSNALTVGTDKLCQGIIEKIINISGSLPYPNPFQNTLHINIGKRTAITVILKIYSLNTGLLKLTKNYTNQSGVISMDVSGLEKGVYSLNVTVDGKETVYKIIK